MIPPPPPKVKLANLMRVLGNEAMQDPSKMEHFVREQVADRQRKQEAVNEARKLTPDERRQKRLRKMCDTTETGPGAIAVSPLSGVVPAEKNVYRVLDLNHSALKYKVETKARHVDDSVIVIHKYCNVVVVDNGAFAQQVFEDFEPRVQKHLMLTGAKQQKRFKRLKLHHIKRPSYKNLYIVGERQESQSRSQRQHSGTNLMASYCRFVHPTYRNTYL